VSELRNQHFTDNFIIPAADWNAAARALPREIQNALGWMFEHEANSGGGVVGGFAASEGAARRSDVARGLALVYASGNAAPLSKWSWVYSETTLQATHDAHEGNPRYDLLTLSWESATDTDETQGQVGGVPAPVDTQRGAQVTLNITKGTAAVTPTVPATPAGHLLLYVVGVPSSSGALIYLDRRVYAAGPSNRPLASYPVTFHGRYKENVGGEGEIGAHLIAINARAGIPGDPEYMSEVRWDMLQDMPIFMRDRVQTGEAPGFYYPLLAYGDRKWWQTFFITPGEVVYTAGDSGDIAASFVGSPTVATVVQKVAGTDACDLVMYIPLPAVQGRKLEVCGAKLDYALSEAFTGADTEVWVRVLRDNAGASSVEIASLDVHDAGVVARASASMGVTDTTIGNQDRLWAVVHVARAGSGITAAGVLAVYAISLQFKEGRG